MTNELNMDILSGLITNFLFILLRSSIFISMLPIIGGKQLPMQFRIGLAVFIALLLTPIVEFDVVENAIPLLVVKELLLGMALGLTVRFLFMAINVGGQFISHTMGMSLARVFNPETGQSTSIAESYGVMAMLFFLSMDAHHDIIYIFVKSYELLPGGQINIMAVVPKVLSMMSSLFVLAIKIGAPIMVGLFIANLLTGFLYKAAPQMNIFFITLPLNIFLGFLLMILSIPVFEHLLGMSISDLREDMTQIIMLAKG